MCIFYVIYTELISKTYVFYTQTDILNEGLKKMKILGIGLQKGGVGKTSITLALAAELAKTSRVLVVDADPQGNSTCGFLQEVNYELADVLLESCEIVDAVVKTPFENIQILPTLPINTRLRDYKSNTKVAEDVFDTKNKIQSISQYFDYCLIDTSPDFSQLEKNLFYACDEIIPVMNCDTFGSDGLTIFLSNIEKFKKKMNRQDLILKTIVLNKYNKSLKLDSEIKQVIEQSNNYNFITVPQDQNFKTCQAEQKLFTGKPETNEALIKLAELVKC